MKNNAFVNNIATFCNKAMFKTKKHSPEILLVVGVVGTVVSTVLACKATTKISTITDETHDTVKKIHDTFEKEEEKREEFERSDHQASDIYTPEYTDLDRKKDLAIVYTQTGLKLVKLYAPAVAVGMMAIACTCTSHGIMLKRNAAVVAAYTALDQGFKSYRKNVVEKFGENVDQELRCGIKAMKYDEVTTDPETGKTKKTKKTVDVTEGDQYVYSFDRDNSTEWQANDDYNEMTLTAQERFANDRLRTCKGNVLMLSDVLHDLGIERDAQSMVTGWIYDPDDNTRDNKVKFRTKKTNRVNANGDLETVYLLDFNVDGYVLDGLPKKSA